MPVLPETIGHRPERDHCAVRLPVSLRKSGTFAIEGKDPPPWSERMHPKVLIPIQVAFAN
jgi:hypothetical protein